MFHPCVLSLKCSFLLQLSYDAPAIAHRLCYNLSFFFIPSSAHSYLVRQRAAFLDGVKPPDFCEGATEKTCNPVHERLSFSRTRSLNQQSQIGRYTETDHPHRRTTLKDLVSVGRRMMYAVVVIPQPHRFAPCNVLAGASKNILIPWIPRKKSCCRLATPSCFHLFSSLRRP